MVFVQTADGAGMFLMLSEADVVRLRAGSTLFVDERQTGGAPFTKVILSLHKHDSEAVALLRKHGLKKPLQPEAQPNADEGRCAGCNGCIPLSGLLDSRCIVCWREEAVKLRTQSN